jgi:hypothetical protein
MPWVIPKSEQLPGKKTVGVGLQQVNKGECAALAQGLAEGVPPVAAWKRGDQVKGNGGLMPGTVIAIFDSNGDYVGQRFHAHQNGIAHTALYLGQTPDGVWVAHQHAGNPLIKWTFIRFRGRTGVSRHGNTPEDDATNYYVVESK